MLCQTNFLNLSEANQIYKAESQRIRHTPQLNRMFVVPWPWDGTGVTRPSLELVLLVKLEILPSLFFMFIFGSSLTSTKSLIHWRSQEIDPDTVFPRDCPLGIRRSKRAICTVPNGTRTLQFQKMWLWGIPR